MEWFFKTTDIIFARDSSVHMPRGAPYFWDPMKTAKHYKDCTVETVDSAEACSGVRASCMGCAGQE
jgi:hypothetical protein